MSRAGQGRRRSLACVAFLTACALLLAATVAGCGGVRAADLFLVERAGSAPGARLTMLVNEEGGVNCNGGRTLKLGDSQLIEARTIQEDPLKFGLLIFLANLIIFSPTQYENWLQGQQLVYYMPILCVTTCILLARSNLATLMKFLICAGLSIISMFSSANGVVCWVVILPMLLFTEWQKNRRLVSWLSAAWIAGLCLGLALYLHGYQKP